MILQKWVVELQGDDDLQDLFDTELAVIISEGLEALGRRVVVTEIELDDEYLVEGAIE